MVKVVSSPGRGTSTWIYIYSSLRYTTRSRYVPLIKIHLTRSQQGRNPPRTSRIKSIHRAASPWSGPSDKVRRTRRRWGRGGEAMMYYYAKRCGGVGVGVGVLLG